MRSIKKILALTLALLMLLGAMTGCSSLGDTMMELEGTKMPVSLYNLYLSRMKGTLSSSYYFGNKALTDSFWDTVIETDGTTYNKYYTDYIFESTKTYLAALYLFDQRELELPDSYIDEIDAKLDELIESDANGSKSQFNSILSDYGVNYKVLREAYIIEAKIDYLKDDIFGADGSLISDELIEDYYQSNYRRFKQVFLYTYDYVYEKDANGHDIYYTESGRIAYDTSKNKSTDENGNAVYDKNGDIIYITKDENGKDRIAYDTKNGERKPTRDEDGNYIISNVSDAEYAQISFEAEQIAAMVKKDDFTGFDSLVEKYTMDEGMEKYPDGYYIAADTDYDSPEVVEKLFELEVGEYATVKSDYGIHIIMRYENEEKAYDEDDYSDFFISNSTGNYIFMDKLRDYLLSEHVAGYKDKIVVDEAIKDSMDIKRIGANYYY